MTSTSLSEAKQSIQQTFIAGWDSTIQIALDNERFDPVQGQTWARLSISHQANTQRTLGPVSTRKFGRQGAVFVQIFVPAKSNGTVESDRLVNIARGIFEGNRIINTSIRFYDVNNRELGIEEGKWFVALVEANFEYDEIK